MKTYSLGKKISLLAFFLLVSLVGVSQVWAQKAPSPQELQNKIALLLHRGINIHFASESCSAQGRSTDMGSGNLWLKGKMFKLHYLSIEAAYDGLQLAAIDHEQQTLTLSKPTPQELATINPLIPLAGSSPSQFRMVYKGESKGTFTYTLTPSNRKEWNGVKKVLMDIDKVNHWPRTIVIHTTDGTLLTFRVRKLSPSNTLSTAFFRFSTSQTRDLEVIDLR